MNQTSDNLIEIKSCVTTRNESNMYHGMMYVVRGTHKYEIKSCVTARDEPNIYRVPIIWNMK